MTSKRSELYLEAFKDEEAKKRKILELYELNRNLIMTLQCIALHAVTLEQAEGMARAALAKCPAEL